METYYEKDDEQEMIDDIMRCIVCNDTPLYLSIPKWEFTRILALDYKKEMGTYLLEIMACFARPDKWKCSANVAKCIGDNWSYYYKKKGELDVKE